MSSSQESTHNKSSNIGSQEMSRGVGVSTNVKATERRKRKSMVDQRALSFNLSRARSGKEAREKAEKLEAIEKARPKKKNSSEFNFVVGTGMGAKRYRFEEQSLGCLTRSNPFRQLFVRVIAHPLFENFILFMILLNAIFFSIADYTHVDENGDIVEEGSTVNAVIIRTNLLFLVVFTLEFAVKVIAQGFIGREGAYLTDSWNRLDFIVVVSSLLVAAVPTLPSVSSLRLIRILRPLRSLTMLPGLRDIVKSIFASLPQLVGVFSLMGFVFLVFSIAGLELFGGASSHARCRATPYPVNTSYIFSVHGTNYEPFRCIAGTNLDTIRDKDTLDKATSPWSTARDCFWPLSEAGTQYEGEEFSRTCSLEGGGMNTCLNGDDSVSEALWSWCGSNFDAYGNRRFLDNDKYGTSNPTGKDFYRNGKYVFNDRDLFIPDLNYGYTNFDSFGMAVITIFQAITEEGWTHILYMNMDSYGRTTAVVYFTLLILMGCFFVLQLLLAVLEDNFHSAKEQVKLEEAAAAAAILAFEEQEKEQLRLTSSQDIETQPEAGAREGVGRDSSDGGTEALDNLQQPRIRTTISQGSITSSDGDGGQRKSFVDENAKDISRLNHLTLQDVVGETVAGHVVDAIDSALKTFRGCKDSIMSTVIELTTEDTATIAERELNPTYKDVFVAYARKVTSWKYFDLCSGILISLNCVTLMADHYPMDSGVEDALDISNALLTIIFALEMGINLSAHGPSAYTKDFLSGFDAFVVVASLIDLCLSPPALWGSTGVDISRVSSVSSVISMMRCFRLFRMIKLAIRIQTLKILFFRVAKTLMDLSTYMILLMVLILIYTVAGLQFFANRFRFDENGEAITKIYTDEWKTAPDVARYNFDDFSSSFASVFQVITTENWNDILYNVWRVMGPGGIIFPMSLVLGGTFILMNLFLGILLSNFEGKGNSSPPESEEESEEKQMDKDVVGKAVEEGEGEGEEGRVKVEGPPMSPDEALEDKIKATLPTPSHKSPSHAYSKALRALPQPSGVESMLGISQPAGTPSRVTPLSITSEREEGVEDGRQPIESPGAQQIRGATSVEDESLDNSKSVLRIVSDAVVALISPVSSPTRVAPDGGGSKELHEVDDNVSHDGVARPHVDSVVHASDLVAERELAEKEMQKEAAKQIETEATKDDSVFPLIEVNVLGLFSAENPFRVWCAHIVDHSWFETGIQVLILLSSISLAIDSPLDDPGSDFRKGMSYFEIITTIIFTIECILKIIVFGFALHKGAYLRSGWNVLDFLIVVISLMSLFNVTDGLEALKSIRSLRALRPLRVISRAPGLRTIVNAVFDSIPDVINVLAVVLVCFSIFAVVSVNFLKGDLRHCTGDHFDDVISGDSGAMSLLKYPVTWAKMTDAQKAYFGPNSAVASFSAGSSACSGWRDDYSGTSCCPQFPADASEGITSKMMCTCWGGDWDAVAYITFDNFPQALMGFFMISTTEGWVDLMYAAVDANGIDMQPLLNVNQGYVYFFVLFIIAGNFFALNLFVGVMIDNFEKTKSAMQGELAFMTSEQQEWIKASSTVMAIRPHLHAQAPKGAFSNWCFRVCESHEFEVGVVVCIFINTMVLASSFFGISDLWRVIFERMNEAFAYLFTVEMIIKLVGLRKVYFQSVWNKFDFAVTVGSDIGIMYFLITGERGAMAVMIVRIFRVLRVVRLMEGLETAKRLLDTLFLTLPGIINISLLLMLILFIYAVLGMQLFAKIQYNESYSRHSNFRTFTGSLLTLVRFSTGEGWGNFMYDASHSLDGCVNDPGYDEDMCGFNDKPDCVELNGCGSIAIFPYLLSFTLFVSMVLFNLFVGVIIEGFQEANDANKSLKNEDYVKFCEHWAKFDPEATCFMSVENLEEFIATLAAPLGLLEQHPTHKETIHFMITLNIKLYNIQGVTDYVHFKDVLLALTTNRIESDKKPDLTSLKHKVNPDDDVIAHTRKLDHVTSVRALNDDGDGEDDIFTLREHYSAIALQSAFRTFKSGVGFSDVVREVSSLVTEEDRDSEGKRDFSHDSNSVPQPISKHNSVDIEGSPIASPDLK